MKCLSAFAHPLAVLGLCLALCTLPTPAAPTPPPGAFPDAQTVLESQPKAVVARLMRDKVVLMSDMVETGGGGGGYVKGLVLFEKPRAQVLQLLSKTERQKEFRTELESLEMVKDSGGSNVTRHNLSMLFIEVSYHVLTRIDAKSSRITWTLAPGRPSDLTRYEGFWELHELTSDRTLARFGTAVDVGPAVPAALQDYATRSGVPESLERIRRWVDSGGTWRP